MPNKTIYVKDEDLPLYESMATEESSISSMFAEFLRSRKPLTMDEAMKAEIIMLCGQVVESILKFIEDHKDAAPEQVYSYFSEKLLTKFVFGEIGEALLKRVWANTFAAPGKITIREPYATLRDQFAMAALQGLMATTNSPLGDKDYKASARCAYKSADAMMEARKQ